MRCLMHIWQVQEADSVTRLRPVLLMGLGFDCRQMHQQQYPHYQARISIAMHKYHHHQRQPVFYYLHEILLKMVLRSFYLYSGITSVPDDFQVSKVFCDKPLRFSRLVHPPG